MKLTLLKFSILTLCFTTYGHSQDSDSFNNEISAHKDHSVNGILKAKQDEVEAFLASLHGKPYLERYFADNEGDYEIYNPFASTDSDTSSVCVSGAGVFGTDYVGEEFDPEFPLSQFEPGQAPAPVLAAAAAPKPQSKENTQPSRKKGRHEPVETRSRSRQKVDSTL